MIDPAATPEEAVAPRDAVYWAQPVGTLKVTDVPAGAVNLNVDGRAMVGALQGFGQLWQKTYRIRLAGTHVTPAEVVATWKANFPAFQPANSRFFPALTGVQPGSVLLINASMTGLPVYTGVAVIYADDVSFTVMTAEAHPEAGWNTFSAYEDEDGCVVAQVQSLARANDPIYEMGFRFFGFGARQQERIWHHVLRSLAAHYGVTAEVEMTRVCVDPHIQWRYATNVWRNAAMRSLLYRVGAPLRAVRGLARRPGTR